MWKLEAQWTVQATDPPADTTIVALLRFARRWVTTILPLTAMAAIVTACGSSASGPSLPLRHGGQGYLVAGQYGLLWYQLEDQGGNRVAGTFEQVSPYGDFTYPESGTAIGDLVSLTAVTSTNGGGRIGGWTYHVTVRGLFDGTYTYRNATAVGLAAAIASAKKRWTAEGLEHQPVSGLYQHIGDRTDSGQSITLTIAPQGPSGSNLLIEVNTAAAQDQGRTQRRVEELTATATAGTLNVISDTHPSGPWSTPLVATYSTIPATITFPPDRCRTLWNTYGRPESGCTFGLVWAGEAFPPTGYLALSPPRHP